MQIIFSSRDLPFTDQIKQLVTSRLLALGKFSSSLSNIRVVLDVERNKRGVSQDAVVELIGDIKGKRLAVRETGATFYKAFFGALKKMKTRVRREVEKHRH